MSEKKTTKAAKANFGSCKKSLELYFQDVFFEEKSHSIEQFMKIIEQAKESNIKFDLVWQAFQYRMLTENLEGDYDYWANVLLPNDGLKLDFGEVRLWLKMHSLDSDQFTIEFILSVGGMEINKADIPFGEVDLEHYRKTHPIAYAWYGDLQIIWGLMCFCLEFAKPYLAHKWGFTEKYIPNSVQYGQQTLF